MNRNSAIINNIPKMLAGEELKAALANIPYYDENIRFENDAARLVELNELYNIYLPSTMSLEIYSKLYLAMLRSLQKKESKLAIQQKNENFKAIQGGIYNGIIGGSDSFTIIGASGIGKSSAIDRAIALITQNQLIEVENPYSKIIPCLITQCPFDSSVKGLLLEILRKVDEWLGSSYYENALRARATTDMLIGSVSQVSLNHIGLLVVDEIQNICNNRNGGSLVAVLTQLINNSGVSICMVGTPESSLFFEQAMQLARRALGLKYGSIPNDKYFREFCETVYKFQCVKQKTKLTDAIVEWLFEHSGGIVSVVVTLVHDAQEVAILSGKEILNKESLDMAYRKRLNMLHNYIRPSIVTNSQTTSRKNKKIPLKSCEIGVPKQTGEYNIVKLDKMAKKDKVDLLKLLKERFSVTEVSI